eukprot:tig00020961_g16721.t1
MCDPKTSRKLLIVANIFNIIGGIVIIAGGIWLAKGGSGATGELATIISTYAQDARVGYAVIGAGVTLLIVGILGLVAAKSTNKCLLFLYGFLLFVAFVFVLAVTVVAFALPKAAEDNQFKTYVDDAVKLATKEKPAELCNAYKRLSCSGGTVACQANVSNAFCPPNCITDADTWASTTCYDKVVPIVKSNALTVAIIGLIWSLILLVGLVFVCCVCCYEKNAGKASSYYTTRV